ncbi:MAG TPA: hypothetical protein VKV17_18830 [Bryobacteraceae bacterium]|nr:hypothetical protein [Bryobacteraceae bacterium]
MKLGANEPKKVVILGALLVLGGYLFYTNVLSGPSAPAARIAPAPPQPAPETASLPADAPVSTRAVSARARTDEFHPVLHSKRPEDRIDPVKIDPTLRLDLLAKLEEVPLPSGGRNPFKMGAPPAPKAAQLPGPEPKVAPKQIEAAKPPAPGGPPPPPITLKYYGFTSPAGASAKTAFFLDGEDILIAKEGDLLKKRYKVVRIGVNSVVMEDTDSKRQQTLPLIEEAG